MISIWRPGKLSRTQMEERRLEGLCLLQEAQYTSTQIAHSLGVNDSTIRHWARKVRLGGTSALRATVGGGQPKRLTNEQEAALCTLIDAGAVQRGFLNEQWTSPRVRNVIGWEFGVWYHVDHVYKLLVRLGYSVQKPDKRAVERDEDAVETWVNTRLGELEKKRRAGATLVFLDESGFSLKTMVTRTWSKRGRTPIVPTKLRWEHLSVIGTITSGGKFYQHTHAGAIRAPHVVTFLTHLLRQVPGEVVVVLDRAMIHRAKIVQELVARTSRLTLENLPPYAPELNPIEHVWAYVKRHVLGNFCAQNVAELKSGLRRAWSRVRRIGLVDSLVT